MNQTESFIHRLSALGEGDRSLLRRLAVQPLDQSLRGFDLFTGVWWPLRQGSPFAPRRETSWMVAKLFGAFPLRAVPCAHDGPATFAYLLGRSEPRHPACEDAALLSSAPPDHEPARSQFIESRRFRTRFDAILQAPLCGLEPHLRWGLSVVEDAVKAGKAAGLDWVQLLNDLSAWDRGDSHRRNRDISDIWAEQYLKGTH